MCGIAGTWGEQDAPLVERMLSRIAHRGPDAEGRHDRKRVSIGHRRLAIVDPEGGDQPLVTVAPATRALVANAEIYNASDLKQQLEEHHTFRTGSDCESILHEYASRREDTAGSLDGMFAFALVDDEDLYLARDPLGIKPLYYAQSGQRLLFASEMKALATEVDEISEFPPGSWYHSKSGFSRYYDVPDDPAIDAPLSEVAARLRATLEEAVVKRLMSDVPVGVLLSGGLDSSIVAALTRRHLEELHTFAVGFAGSPDLDAARRVASYIRSTHHEYRLREGEIERCLPEILFHLESFDCDLVRSAVPCYFVCKLAADHVKVVLTGEGADELFAGYAYHRQIADDSKLHRELRRSIEALHNVNLQRVDRMSMAHGLEARVPFLDVEMVDLAQRIPPHMKLNRRRGSRDVEKWVLRAAFEDLLPPEILWREKMQFDTGSAATPALRKIAADTRTLEDAPDLRAREELRYRDLLASSFDSPEPVLANVAHWAARPDF